MKISKYLDLNFNDVSALLSLMVSNTAVIKEALNSNCHQTESTLTSLSRILCKSVHCPYSPKNGTGKLPFNHTISIIAGAHFRRSKNCSNNDNFYPL
jgi:hypothetical protein